MTKDELVNKLVGKLNFMFVDEYNEMNTLIDIVNLYLKDINVSYKYNYDILCKDIVDNVSVFIGDIGYDSIEIEDSSIFMYGVIVQVIKNRIGEHIKDVDSRTEALIKHNLNYHLLTK